MSPLLVAVETPQHAGLADLLAYESERALAPGSLLRVPLGRREVPGVVWAERRNAAETPAGMQLKPVLEVLSCLPPLPPAWCALVEFTAHYYQRAIGEVALSVLPPELRKLDDTGLSKRIRKLQKQLGVALPEGPPEPASGKPKRRKAAPADGSEPAAAESPQAPSA